MKDKLKIPQIGQYIRNTGKIVRIEEIPQPTLIDYIIEEGTARCELRMKDKLLKNLGEYNDFYGQDTCKDGAIKDMIEYCEELGITKDSELEVVVVYVVEQSRMRPNGRKNFCEDEYADFSAIEWGNKIGVADDVETVIWSSKKDL
jgi:hypothetical protein